MAILTDRLTGAIHGTNKTGQSGGEWTRKRQKAVVRTAAFRLSAARLKQR